MNKQFISIVRSALRATLSAADKLASSGQSLRDALIKACGKPGLKSSDKAFRVLRKEICANAKSINETLKGCAGKVYDDLTAVEKACRDHRTLSVTWTNLQPAKAGKRSRKAKASKVTVTKVQGVGKAQVAALATKPDRFKGMLTVAIATLQAAEAPKYKDAPGLIAALQVAIGLCQ